MSWRKKNDWEGYKSFLLESDIWEEFNQRYDYTTRRYVGNDTSKERITLSFNGRRKEAYEFK